MPDFRIEITMDDSTLHVFAQIFPTEAAAEGFINSIGAGAGMLKLETGRFAARDHVASARVIETP